MQSLTRQFPVYDLVPDATGNKDFRYYHFEGNFPDQSELLIPHRKSHYLFVFVRQASVRQWIDMVPYRLQNNRFYFSAPGEVIVKEEFARIWSTGIAFTNKYLQESESLHKLPIIKNSQNIHELELSREDVDFVENILARIRIEYELAGNWQQRMLSAYLGVLLTYLSRLYVEQHHGSASPEQALLKKFQAEIDNNYLQLHEVSEYAELLNISAGHLSEVIKQQSGKPAIKHIHDRLVMEAKRLLVHTETSSKEIAFDLGFTDTSYFNRFFKRESGLTPGEYRNSIREMYH